MKVKLIAFLIVTFLSTTVFSQDEPIKDFPLGIEIIGGQTYYQLKGVEKDLLEVETGILFGIGAIFSQSIKANFDLDFGIGFRNLNYEEKDFTPISPDPLWFETKADFQFASGSVFIKYKSKGKRLRMYAKLGAEIWYHVSTKGDFFINEGGGPRLIDPSFGLTIKPIQAIHFSLATAFGLEMSFKKFILFIEGRGMYFPINFFKENENANLNILPLGINIGVQF